MSVFGWQSPQHEIHRLVMMKSMMFPCIIAPYSCFLDYVRICILFSRWFFFPKKNFFLFLFEWRKSDRYQVTKKKNRLRHRTFGDRWTETPSLPPSLSSGQLPLEVWFTHYCIPCKRCWPNSPGPWPTYHTWNVWALALSIKINTKNFTRVKSCLTVMCVCIHI